jgi:hypothetical protein
MQVRTFPMSVGYKVHAPRRAAWPPPALKESLEAARMQPRHWRAPRVWSPATER